MTSCDLPNRCLKAYRDGLEEQQSYGWCDSFYEIRDVAHYLKNEDENLIRIGKCRVKKGRYCSGLRHCMPDDSYIWVRRLPEVMCRYLGKKIVGAIDDLDKIGVPQSTINYIHMFLNQRVEGFIEQAEEARLTIKGNWKRTARELSEGCGPVYELAVDFLYIVSFVMAEAGIDE